MDPKPPINYGKGPEAKIQEDIIRMLERYGWTVIVTHGNEYQFGLPDLYAMRPIFKSSKGTHGESRWIEVKNPERFSFTRAQIQRFPEFLKAGIGIWVMVAATETEYKKLFDEPNLWVYMNRFSKTIHRRNQ